MRAALLASDDAGAVGTIRCWPRSIAAPLLCACGLAAILTCPSVNAQAAKPEIVVANNIVVPAAGEVRLSIAIRPATASPRGGWLGVISSVLPIKLSVGLELDNGWVVPLSDLNYLKIRVPEGVSGSSPLWLFLFDDRGAELAEASAEIIVEASTATGAARPEPRATARAPGGPVDSERRADLQPSTPTEKATASPLPARPPSATGRMDPATPPAPSPPGTAPLPADPPTDVMAEPRTDGDRQIELGERQLAQGNIAAAREYFLRAAENGSPRGALLLAQTYDGDMLARLRVVGVKPNPIEARRWYQRALELGAPEAAERLRRLDVTSQ